MFIGIGALIMLIGIIWFIVLSFQVGGSTAEKVIWAVVNFLFQPIAGIIFFFVKKAGLVPLILVLIGVVFYGYGLFTSLGDVMQQMPK
jgi:hypothetical protein